MYMPFSRSHQQETAFSTLKPQLCEEPLSLNPEFSKRFIVTTDDSRFVIEGILYLRVKWEKINL